MRIAMTLQGTVHKDADAEPTISAVDFVLESKDLAVSDEDFMTRYLAPGVANVLLKLRHAAGVLPAPPSPPSDVEIRIVGASMSPSPGCVDVLCVADGYAEEPMSIYLDGADWTPEDIDAEAHRKYREFMRVCDYVHARMNPYK